MTFEGYFKNVRQGTVILHDQDARCNLRFASLKQRAHRVKKTDPSTGMGKKALAPRFAVI